jgi:hypothetical protein
MKFMCLISLTLIFISNQNGVAYEASADWFRKHKSVNTEKDEAITQYAFVTTTDWQTGHFATINLEDQSVKIYDVALNSDAVAKTISDKIYVVNRLGQDNITIFSPPNFSTPLIQFSTGNGSNPHDIVLSSSDKAYITLFEKNYLLVVNPNTGEELKKIDISSFADSDGIPEADQMVIVNGILYVTLQKLDRFNYYQPAGKGQILMIDTVSDTILGSVPLTGQNPYDINYQNSMNKLIVSEVGSFYDAQDGGIETIDLSGCLSWYDVINKYDSYVGGQTVWSEVITCYIEYTTHGISGFILSEKDLGGNITDFVMKPLSSQGYIIVTDSSYNTSIVSFDLEQAVKLKDILIGKDFIYSGIALGNEKLLVGERPNLEFSNPTGVRIISTLNDEEITTKPINTGLPPLSITIY